MGRLCVDRARALFSDAAFHLPAVSSHLPEELMITRVAGLIPLEEYW